MDNNFSQEQINEMIQMYKNGTSIDLIIQQFNSDEHNIREVFKKYEVDRHYNMWNKEVYDRAIALYKSGLTLEKIAYALVVSENGLSKALKKKEIEMRTYSESNRRYKRNSEYFDNINTPNKAYILGLIYADGNNYIRGNKHCFTLSLQERDHDLLERVRQELEYEGELRFVPLHEQNNRYMNQYTLVITDEYMCEQLKKIGVVQRKSLILKFPTFLRPDLIRHFVRGYFDGDGCLSYDTSRNKEHTGVCGTFEFISSLSNILKSMFVNNHIYHPKQSGDSNTFVLETIGNLSSYKFLSWMYQDCDMKMDRKYQRYLDFCERYTNPKGRIKSL